MARSFNGSSDKIQSTVNLTPLNNLTDNQAQSWACWFKTSNTGTSAMALVTTWLFQTNGGCHLEINDGAARTLGFILSDVTASNFRFVQTNTNTAIGDNNWHHALLTYDGSGGIMGTAGMQFYIDGAAVTTNSVHNTPSGAFTISTFQMGHLSGGASEFYAGSLADVAIWNVKLTAGEAAALGLGARPYMIRPLSLVHWSPLDGLQSPEPDLSGNRNIGTLTGTALAPGPPVAQFTPRWPQFFLPPPPFTLMPQIVM